MPLHAASYFAGVGTVLATMSLGFGAGALLTEAFVGKNENPPSLANVAPRLRRSQPPRAQSPRQRRSHTCRLPLQPRRRRRLPLPDRYRNSASAICGRWRRRIPTPSPRSRLQ